MAFKLGKLAPKHNDKTLLFSKYLKADAPPPPPEKAFYEYAVDPSAILMYGNDTVGDCTCAAVAHYIILATAHTGKVFFPDPADVMKMYSAISGYDPVTGANDDGCAMTDVLNFWQTVGLSGHKILGWAKLDYTNLTALHQGIELFGANYVGVNLPASAQDQFEQKKNWEFVKKSPIEGGHCILETGFGSDGSNYQTWGKGDQKASNAWSAAYRDEAYIVLTQDWINQASGLAANHLNMDALQADLKLLAA